MNGWVSEPERKSQRERECVCVCFSMMMCQEWWLVVDSSGVIRVLPGIWAVGIMKLICTLFTEQRDQGGGPAATHSDVGSVETLELETHPGQARPRKT